MLLKKARKLWIYLFVMLLLEEVTLVMKYGMLVINNFISQLNGFSQLNGYEKLVLCQAEKRKECESTRSICKNLQEKLGTNDPIPSIQLN